MDRDSAHLEHGNQQNQLTVSQNLINLHKRKGKFFGIAAIVMSVLFILGVFGFILKVSEGVDDPSERGYYAALVSFLITAGQGALMVAIATRLVKAHWRRPISRAAEMFAVVGLYNLILLIPLLWVLPGLSDGRRSLWFFNELKNIPENMPQIQVLLSMIFLVLAGIGLLWISSLPDLAVIRDSEVNKKKKGLIGRLSGQWYGTSRQWFIQYHRLGMMGAFYFMMLITTHFLFSMDFSMTLVPGWIDALYPATHAHNSLQAGIAIVLIAMFILRRFGGYGDYIKYEQFWGLGKLLFAASLLWFWFWFSSFIVFWYGAKPNEQGVLELLMVGPYLPVFLVAFTLNFLVPLFTMMWNPLRRSIWGPTVIAFSVLLGTVFDRIRIYVSSWSVATQENKHLLTEIPSAIKPDVADILMWLGGISGAILIYLLATRIIPVVSIWEQKELLLYRIHKPFHRLEEVLVLGKKD